MGDPLTYTQLADKLDSALGKNVQRVQWSVPMQKAELTQTPTDAIKKYRGVFAEGNGVAWDQTLSFNAKADETMEDRSAALEWLIDTTLALDGKAPIFLLTTDAGLNAVEELLTRIDYGVYT